MTLRVAGYVHGMRSWWGDGGSPAVLKRRLTPSRALGRCPETEVMRIFHGYACVRRLLRLIHVGLNDTYRLHIGSKTRKQQEAA